MTEDLRKKLREQHEEKAVEDIAPIRDPLDDVMKGKRKLKDIIYKGEAERKER
ncbi:MAG: hypothetical protein QMC77_08380 [Methanocellales archaeon]|nr:hypothetical protein [Methanocellales archaeon]